MKCEGDNDYDNDDVKAVKKGKTFSSYNFTPDTCIQWHYSINYK
jgi:hypothetical protein